MKWCMCSSLLSKGKEREGKLFYNVSGSLINSVSVWITQTQGEKKEMERAQDEWGLKNHNYNSDFKWQIKGIDLWKCLLVNEWCCWQSETNSTCLSAWSSGNNTTTHAIPSNKGRERSEGVDCETWQRQNHTWSQKRSTGGKGQKQKIQSWGLKVGEDEVKG